MGSQQFCLRWNNHQSNILSVFDKLLTNGSFVDVTLACEGASLKAHKMVLSACSPFFEEIFIENPCKHPVVIMRDIKLCDLKAIIEFMYKGEVSVGKDQLGTLIKTAEALKIKGLAEITNEQTQKVVRPSLPLQFTGGRIPMIKTEPETCESLSHHRKRKRHDKDENGDVDDESQPVDMTHDSKSEVSCPQKANSLNSKPKSKTISESLCPSMRNSNSDAAINSRQHLKIFSSNVNQIPIANIKQSPPSSPVTDNSENPEYVDPAAYYRSLNLETVYPGQSTAFNHPASGLNLLDSLKNEFAPPEQTEIRPESLIRGRGRAPNWTQEDMRNALQAVMSGHGSKKTARLYNIPWSTLKRYIRRSRTQPDSPFPGSNLIRNSSSPVSSVIDLPVDTVNVCHNNNNTKSSNKNSLVDNNNTSIEANKSDNSNNNDLSDLQNQDASASSSPTNLTIDQSLGEPLQSFPLKVQEAEIATMGN